MNIFNTYQKTGAFLLYALITAALFAPVVFMSKSLQPPLSQPYGLVNGFPYGYAGRTPVPVFNIDTATPAYYEWPSNKFVGDSYKGLDLPLWNPYQGLGFPMAAQYSTRVFFPYQLIENIAPIWLSDYFLLGRSLLAGFFTFLFLRLLGLGFVTAFLGGLFYMFSGAFTWFLTLEQYSNTAMMLPIHLFLLENLVRKRTPAGLALAGISFALVILAGQPETALFVLFLGLFFFIFRAAQSRIVLKSGMLYSLVALTGFLLAAPLILPFLELVRNSFNLHPPGGGMGVDLGVRSFMDLFEVLQIFTPTALEQYQNNPSFMEAGLTPDNEPYHFRIFPINGAWDFTGGYTGIIPLFLIASGLAVAFKSKDRRFFPYLLFFSAVAAAILLKNLGCRPFLWIGYLPLFDMVWTQRWAGPVWIFCMAAAAAFACQMLIDRCSDIRPGASGRCVPAMSGALVSLLTYLPFCYVTLSNLSLPGYGLIDSTMLQMKKIPMLLPSWFMGSVLTIVFLALLSLIVLFAKNRQSLAYGVLSLAILELWWAIPRAYEHYWLYAKLIPLALGLTAAYAFFYRRLRVGFLFVGSAVLAFMLLDSLSAKGLPQRHDPFAQPPYVDFLKSNSAYDRVVGGYGMLFPNFASSVGLFDIRYITALMPRDFHVFKNRYLQEEKHQWHSLWFTGRKHVEARSNADKFEVLSFEDDFFANLQYFSLLGVKHIVLPPDMDLNLAAEEFTRDTGLALPHFVKVYTAPDATIYENPSAFPRAFLVNSVLQVPSGQALDFIGKVDLRNTAILEKGAALNPVSQTAQGDIEFLEYGNNSVLLRADVSEPAFMVVTDLFYPGWKAYVDGKPAEVHRVDGVVRGVFLGKGRHEVSFIYRPGSFTAGVALFSIGCVSIIFLTINKRTRKFISE